MTPNPPAQSDSERRAARAVGLRLLASAVALAAGAAGLVVVILLVRSVLG